jgi:allantoicase
LTTAAREQHSLTPRSLDHGREADPLGPARLPDLASAALGGTVVFASDELFADARNLVSAAPAAHDPAAFGPRGKVYDGWETRRRREAGSDFVIVRLAAPAIVRAVNIDTSFFTGNFPPYASLEAATVMGYPSPEEVLAAAWTPLLGRTRLRPDTGNIHSIRASGQLATHVRLTIYPDGGVARLRVYGEVVPDPRRLGSRVDLAASLHGATVSGCSNMFYSSPLNVLAPGRAAVMSDGWETARRRDEGNDWLTVRLAAPGVLHDTVIDTTRFVGNAPGWARLTNADTGTEPLPLTRLQPDTEHHFRLVARTAVGRVRLDIYPDGGISRLRLNGTIPTAEQPAITDRWEVLIPPRELSAVDQSEYFS